MIVKKINKLTLLLALAGFFVSLYALIVHIETLLSPGGGAFCDVSATVNCSAVIGSSYGEFASIPLGSYGMAYFAIVLAALLTPKFATITKKQLAVLELIIALAGLFVVFALMLISYGILKLVCPTCSIVHGIVIIYAILKIYAFFKTPKDSVQPLPEDMQSGDALTRFFALAICFAIPPLLAGLLTPFMVNFFAHQKSRSAPSEISKYSQNVQNSVEKSALFFNKTNYVGDGEDYRRGNDNAPVIVQIFSDFACPHCKTANDSLVKAQDTVGQDKVLIVYRFYPLSDECNPSVGGKGVYKYNCRLVTAARCAGVQGKFWEFKEWAFEGQNWTNQHRDTQFSLDGLKNKAKQLNLNVQAFADCLQNHQEDNKIKNDIIFANQFNIKGTPFILINGKEYKGSLSPDAFVKEFEQEL